MPAIKNNKILFIVNPNSGKQKAEKLIYSIRTIDPEFSIALTRNLKERAKTFKQNIEKYQVFIVVGGDGSVNKAIKYLIGRNDKILAVYPAGSGNGFSNELGFTKNLEKLIEDARRGESMLVDVLSVNKKNCINIAGLGFDSYVAHQFQGSSGRGLKNYIWATLKSVFTFKSFEAKLKIDGVKISGRYQMISIANTRQFGNNAIISPKSKPNDAIFELVLAKPFPFYLYPVFVVKMFRGTLKESKYVSFIQIKKNIKIESDFKMYHIDGEPKVFKKNLTAKMKKNKIRVLKTSSTRFM